LFALSTGGSFWIKINEHSYIELAKNDLVKETIIDFALCQIILRKFATKEDYFYQAKLWSPFLSNWIVELYLFYVRVFRERAADIDVTYRCGYLFFIK